MVVFQTYIVMFRSYRYCEQLVSNFACLPSAMLWYWRRHFSLRFRLPMGIALMPAHPYFIYGQLGHVH